MDIVFADSSMIPIAAGLVKENAVIAFAELTATCTVTVYDVVELSAAVTVYTTGPVKLFGVTPLVWSTPLTCTFVPLKVKVATRVVTSVPEGTVTAMVFAT